MLRQSRIANVELKLDHFLTNDWVHSTARIDQLNLKLNLLLVGGGMILMGVFIPLAFHFWKTWLNF